MFLVLIEHDETDGEEWFVCGPSPEGPKSTFDTRNDAVRYAMELAHTQTNRFSVVEIKSWYQQVAKVQVRETSVG